MGSPSRDSVFLGDKAGDKPVSAESHECTSRPPTCVFMDELGHLETMLRSWRGLIGIAARLLDSRNESMDRVCLFVCGDRMGNPTAGELNRSAISDIIDLHRHSDLYLRHHDT